MKPIGNTKNHKPYKFPNEKNGIKILKHLPFEPKKKRYVIAECPKCKSQWKTRMDSLVPGRTCKICSDITATKKRVKHGMSSSTYTHPIYQAWINMKARVKNSKFYKNVSICDEWSDFTLFKEWALNNGWENGFEIDKDILCDKLKINPKIYSPKTCCWITKKENQNYAKKGKK